MVREVLAKRKIDPDILLDIDMLRLHNICVDCPLTDSEGSQLLSNGEEKLAERMVKDSEPRKSLGGLEYKWDIDSLIRKAANAVRSPAGLV